MKKFSSLILMGLFGVFCTTSVFGLDAETQANLSVGVRAEPIEERMAEQQASYELAKAESEKPQAKTVAKSLSKAVYSTTHNGAFQTLYAVNAFGDIELLDGSVWKVSSGDVYTVLTWYASDLLVISPNNSWFSSYQFKITNQATGQAVVANMTLGPIYNGPYTHWIVAIDYFWDKIYLEDGTVWSMSAFDSGIISKWLVNDTVIIGINDGLFSSLRPNILINVNTLNYAAGSASY